MSLIPSSNHVSRFDDTLCRYYEGEDFLSHLNLHSLCDLSQTNRSWRSLIDQPFRWNAKKLTQAIQEGCLQAVHKIFRFNPSPKMTAPYVGSNCAIILDKIRHGRATESDYRILCVVDARHPISSQNRLMACKSAFAKGLARYARALVRQGAIEHPLDLIELAARQNEQKIVRSLMQDRILPMEGVLKIIAAALEVGNLQSVRDLLNLDCCKERYGQEFSEFNQKFYLDLLEINAIQYALVAGHPEFAKELIDSVDGPHRDYYQIEALKTVVINGLFDAIKIFEPVEEKDQYYAACRSLCITHHKWDLLGRLLAMHPISDETRTHLINDTLVFCPWNDPSIKMALLFSLITEEQTEHKEKMFLNAFKEAPLEQVRTLLSRFGFPETIRNDCLKWALMRLSLEHYYLLAEDLSQKHKNILIEQALCKRNKQVLLQLELSQETKIEFITSKIRSGRLQDVEYLLSIEFLSAEGLSIVSNFLCTPLVDRSQMLNLASQQGLPLLAKMILEQLDYSVENCKSVESALLAYTPLRINYGQTRVKEEIRKWQNGLTAAQNRINNVFSFHLLSLGVAAVGALLNTRVAKSSLTT